MQLLYVGATPRAVVALGDTALHVAVWAGAPAGSVEVRARYVCPVETVAFCLTWWLLLVILLWAWRGGVALLPGGRWPLGCGGCGGVLCGCGE